MADEDIQWVPPSLKEPLPDRESAYAIGLRDGLVLVGTQTRRLDREWLHLSGESLSGLWPKAESHLAARFAQGIDVRIREISWAAVVSTAASESSGDEVSEGEVLR